MTDWVPELKDSRQPIYLRLADAIEEAIVSDELPPGSKLPPQRNLAFDLGVTLGTVTRAYQTARERGLLTGEVGRGTFVRNGNGGDDNDLKSNHEPIFSMLGRGFTDEASQKGPLIFSSTSAPNVGQMGLIRPVLERVMAKDEHRSIDYVRRLPRSWSEAGAKWLAVGDWEPDPFSTFATHGADPAILAAMATVAAPGERIVMETPTYKCAAQAIGLIGRIPIVGECDEEGLRPDEFERLCARQHPRAVFLMPAAQNPTHARMSEDRRRDIVDIARRHNVWIIEDNVYGSLLTDHLTPLAALAPERTFHLSSLSKSVGAGLRGGWMTCPPGQAPRAASAHKVLAGPKSFLLAQLSAELVLSGAADEIREQVRHELAARHQLICKYFDGFEFASNPHLPFVWLKLPEQWSSASFVRAAEAHGLRIDGEDEYKPVRSETQLHRVRIGTSAVPTRENVEHGLSLLAGLLLHGAAAYETFA
ncbi:PLP-dependent aminotransferase family protein [Notoacmeibacter sp. MSK16QG-6]|uniref:aminotransferase-like domain-containing protein n=1 Tax=Notoacmeibacter sp. MSK16QG-6 TaxID=2957982 RepID=UPI0020A18874|nr:PLP-dependent aminotransferase family protein [Notoacmeibacter sp. MSK16QG-6]MCP1199454.1 PLP-dependent aminotransferase family protein [Notoacmeibacter sp. MSK16QG-6]